jgi:hypothetical protein
METKIININDIEDLILCKFEIENKLLEKGIIESKMQIDEFILKYALTDYVYMVDDKFIPFNIYTLDDTKYVFITEENETDKNILLNKLKSMKYDLNNKVEINISELLTNEELTKSLIIHDKKYYK